MAVRAAARIRIGIAGLMSGTKAQVKMGDKQAARKRVIGTGRVAVEAGRGVSTAGVGARTGAKRTLGKWRRPVAVARKLAIAAAVGARIGAAGQIIGVAEAQVEKGDEEETTGGMTKTKITAEAETAPVGVTVGAGAEAKAGTGVARPIVIGVTAAQAERGDEEEARRRVTETRGVEAEAESDLPGTGLIEVGAGTGTGRKTEIKRGAETKIRTRGGATASSVKMREEGGEAAVGTVPPGNAAGAEAAAPRVKLQNALQNLPQSQTRAQGHLAIVYQYQFLYQPVRSLKNKWPGREWWIKNWHERGRN